MIFRPLALKGAYEIELPPRLDERGQFTRLLCMKELSSIGHRKTILQVNHSRTRYTGTIRGMHFQRSPRAEIKMIKCVRGRVFDVAVDLRKTSQTFLKWQAIELSEMNNLMMYIPEGFAHGFQSLENDSELLYFHTEYYTPEMEDGIRYDDPVLKISWPLKVSNVSSRDLALHPINVRTFKGLIS